MTHGILVTKPHIVCFESYDEWDSVPLNDLFNVHSFPASGDPLDLPETVRKQVQAFAFKGHSALDAKVMDAFPNLGLIANYGVGYDTIDVAHATTKGVRVTNTPDVLTNDVADLAIGMLLAISRNISGAAEWVSSGQWAAAGAFPLQRTISGASIGIAGLGRIGLAIAERLQGFQTDIHYFSQSKKNTPGWQYHDNLVSLAKSVDVLMVAVSGGPATAKIISSDVIAALGPDGLLVNSARGTTIDEAALLDALENNRIRGAALDVFENEPNIDPRFMNLNNVLLQPHHSSGTVETRQAMGALQRQNLTAFFAGNELVTPVN